MVNLEFNSHPQRTTLSAPTFNPPHRTTTKVAYAVAEAEMVFALMMYHQNQLQAVDRQGSILEPEESTQTLFNLSHTQCAALETLYKSLITEAGTHTCKQALYQVLFSLYLEDQPLAQAAKTFTSPVAAYFALKCWDDNGMFINTRDIPVALAKLQYSIRLRCSHKILLSIGEQGMGNQWVEWVDFVIW